MPYYEEMARNIHWWRYSGCRMSSGTPYYIIAGEFGITMALAVCARWSIRGKPASAAFAGIAGGILIFAGYAAAYYVIDGWQMPAR